MSFRNLTALVLALALFGCSKTETTAPPQETQMTMTTDEYAVLSALMDSLLGGYSVPAIILEDSTQTGIFAEPTDSALSQTLRYVGEHLVSLKTETIDDFKGKNLHHAYIDSPRTVHPAFVRASEGNFTFPSCAVSRVGFSPDRGQALVYAGIVWAPLAGGGSYYVMVRVQNRWVIYESVMVWIS